MNRFFEFSHAQKRTLVVLAAGAALISGYLIVRHATQPPAPVTSWTVAALEAYRPALRVDINHAPADSLELVPGIGPVLAERIVALRSTHGRFAAVDSLVLVTGIGPAKLKQVRGFLKVTAP